MLLKNKNLSVEVRNVIELISNLMNERQMNVARIITMMYDLIEENVFDDEKSVEESSSNIFEIDLMNEKSVKESNIEQFINLSNIMKRIKATYFDDDVLQQFMNAKRTEKRKISFNFYKKNVRLKLKDCKIQNDFFESKIAYTFQRTKNYTSLLSKLHMNLNRRNTQKERRHMIK